MRVEDSEGRPCPLAENVVRFTVTGPGTIAGVDNGDPATVAPFQANQRAAFNGLALVIVRSTRGRAGTIRVDATSDGLASATVRVITIRH